MAGARLRPGLPRADGILGIEALHFRLPWVKAPAAEMATVPLGAFSGGSTGSEGLSAAG